MYSRKIEVARKKSSEQPEIPEDYTTCEYTSVIHRTEKGILINFGDREDWLPKSQVILWKDKGKNRISMPEKLYKSKNL